MNVRAFLVWVGVAVAGCAANPEIRSAKAPDLHGPLRALFVISEVGGRDEIAPDHFKAELERIAARCRIRIGISMVSELELDPEVHVRRMQAFAARHALMVSLVGVTERERQFGGRNIVEARYDARLQEDGKRTVWRAALSVKLGGGDELGSETLAYGLMDKLGEDGVIQRCATRARPAPEGAYAH